VAGNPANLECDPDLPGSAEPTAMRAVSVSGCQRQPGLSSQPATVQRISAQLGFLEPNYLNPSTFCPCFPAVWISDRQEFCLPLLAAGQLQHRERSGRRLHFQSCLQLQRRKTYQPADQRQHDPRRFNDQQLRGGSASAVAAGQTPAASPFTVSGCGVSPTGTPWVDSSLMNFFRPSGLNPSIAGAYLASGGAACVGLAQTILQSLSTQRL